MMRTTSMKCNRLMSGMLTAVMLTAVTIGVLAFPGKANAEAKIATAVGEKGIVSVEYSNAEFETYRTDEVTAPARENYLFGGWYTDQELTNAMTEATAQAHEGVAFAKFVPASVMSVKTQLRTEAYADNSNGLRLLSSVDNGRYSEVGFNLYLTNDKAYTVTEAKNLAKVYEKITVASGAEFTPNAVFHQASSYFMTCAIKVPENFTDEVLYVQPYWVTKDGTTVNGLAKYVRVCDAQASYKDNAQNDVKGYVSVPISVCSAEAIAAGALKVTYDSSILEYVDYVKFGDFGTSRLLKNIMVNSQVNEGMGTISCVGYANNVTNVKANEDVYINLLFKVKDSTKWSTTSTEQFLNFEITGEDFWNVTGDTEKEVQGIETSIWNIQY